MNDKLIESVKSVVARNKALRQCSIDEDWDRLTEMMNDECERLGQSDDADGTVDGTVDSERTEVGRPDTGGDITG